MTWAEISLTIFNILWDVLLVRAWYDNHNIFQMKITFFFFYQKFPDFPWPFGEIQNVPWLSPTILFF